MEGQFCLTDKESSQVFSKQELNCCMNTFTVCMYLFIFYNYYFFLLQAYTFRIWARQGCVYRLASFLHQLEANNKQFQNIVVRCMFMYFHIIFKERSYRVRMRMQHDPRQLELHQPTCNTPAQAEVLCAALASQYCSVTIQHESRHRLFLTAVIAKYFLMFHEKHLSQICSYYTVQYPEAK